MEFTIQNQNNNIDNQTIVSELSDDIDTGTTNTTSFSFDEKLCEVKANVNTELNKLNLDNLKDKCKELGITGISKMKKPELVQLLENEFMKCLDILKDKKIADLKNMCKACSIKKIGSKKEILIYQILSWNSSNMIFRIDETKFQNTTEVPKENNNETTTTTNDKPLSLIEQLEKQKQEIELKMQAELKKQEEEEQRKQEEEQRRQQEEIRKQEEEERKRIEEEKKEAKKKKQSIPKNVRVIVWNHYIGEDIIKHRCLCCKKVVISNTNFEVGHVLSEKNGGTHEINNLRPICFACNHSMGSENMIDFVVKFGLYIG